MLDRSYYPAPSSRWLPDVGHALGFFLCLVLMAVTFMVFIRQGWGLIHPPEIVIPKLDFSAFLNVALKAKP